jgi:hypothetical protein
MAGLGCPWDTANRLYNASKGHLGRLRLSLTGTDDHSRGGVR